MTLTRFTSTAIAVAFILLTGSLAWSQAGVPPNEAGKPRIEVPETSFDFGYVPQGVKISHVYWLKNTGEDTLFIRDIKPG
jgi:hypothetical protein